MPFTEPPSYDQNRETWPSFVGETVIVEPIKKLEQVETRYGKQDAYECIVWVLTDDQALLPHAGIRIFNSRIVAQLEVAHRVQSPIPGIVQREGNSIQLVAASPEIQEILSRLWDGEAS